jgi:hypothetical protein
MFPGLLFARRSCPNPIQPLQLLKPACRYSESLKINTLLDRQACTLSRGKQSAQPILNIQTPGRFGGNLNLEIWRTVSGCLSMLRNRNVITFRAPTRLQAHCYTWCCISLVYTATTSSISRIVFLPFHCLPVAALCSVLMRNEDNISATGDVQKWALPELYVNQRVCV